MKKSKIIIVCLVVFISLCSCANKGKDKKVNIIEHFNICIVPDLSNRINNKLYPKAVDDTQLVNAIVDDIYPNILRNRVKINQSDKIKLKFTSTNILSYYDVNNESLSFDFSDYNRQVERINYLDNRDDNNLFEQDKNAFKNEFSRVIESARSKSCGADIWSFFNNLTNNAILVEQPDNKNKKCMSLHEFKNVIILITDGYIEAGLYGKSNGIGNKRYHLSSNSIKNFRTQFKKSKETDYKIFFRNNGYGLMPLKNPLLKNVEVLAVEFYDRSLSPSGNASVHPTDGEILELFWTDWMKESGVKKFKCCKITSSVKEFLHTFHKFAGIKLNNRI